MHLSDLFENKKRSSKTLEAMAQPYFEKLIRQCRSKRQPMMFRSVRDFIREIADRDPTCNPFKGTYEAKYFGWLLRRFMEDPWMVLEKGWNDKRRWETQFSRARLISDALKFIHSGKIGTRDVNAFKSFDEMIAVASDQFPKKNQEFRMELQMRENSGHAVVFMHGQKAGSFTLDFTHRAEKKVSIHSFMAPSHQGKGIGYRVYGWLTQKLREKGYTLIPSDRLTDRAYHLWLKRDPTAVEGYLRTEEQISPDGVLWISPYLQKKSAQSRREKAEWEAEGQRLATERRAAEKID